mmetsp:Transcript_3642/g.4049  ORF Transcript_3642/g.4049 Transcript_3642/m.4049 type:complete len:304 (-) Transcript_3642:3536-4447(-)
MVVLLVSHKSTFASYIIAFSIFLYYRSRGRSIKIIVVELNTISLNKTNHDIKPWCGVTTLNNLHFDNHEFIFNYLLSEILLLPLFGMFALNLVNISRKIANRQMNMDIPLNSQNNVIQVSLSDKLSNKVGLIYHPILLMNKLRFIMSNNNVVFTSLASNLNIKDLIDNIRKLEPLQDIISLDYTDGNPGSMNNFSYLMHSNLMNVEYMNKRTKMSRKPPSYILWLPKFRGDLEIPGYDSLQKQIIPLPTHTRVRITTRNNHTFNDATVIDVDVFSALKLADYTLKLINQMINLGNISLITNRL